MKKKVITLAVSLVLLVALAGCDYDEVQNEKSDNGVSMFTVVEETICWKVVYHNETKVMYVVSYGSYNSGSFTLLVDANGNPMLYD